MTTPARRLIAATALTAGVLTGLFAPASSSARAKDAKQPSPTPLSHRLGELDAGGHLLSLPQIVSLSQYLYGSSSPTTDSTGIGRRVVLDSAYPDWFKETQQGCFNPGDTLTVTNDQTFIDYPKEMPLLRMHSDGETDVVWVRSPEKPEAIHIIDFKNAAGCKGSGNVAYFKDVPGATDKTFTPK